MSAGRAEADLRAKLRYEYEQKLWAAAWKWVQDTPLCPECKTADGLINWQQDGMEVRGNYCYDPHLWHAAGNRVGSYRGITQQDALLKIGARLARQ